MMSILMALIPDMAKPILKMLFSPKKIKYTLMAIGVLILVGITWYLTDKYADMKVKVAEQNVMISSLMAANGEIALQLVTCIANKKEQREEFEQAVIRRKSLEHALIESKKDMQNEMAVFEKECGRIERLMQKKSSLILRYANRATNQLWNDLSEATNKHD